MLVMGSMIGSGIFIVSAEISREVDSPALLIGAWLITGFLTIVGALSYGELAAMMPRAGRLTTGARISASSCLPMVSFSISASTMASATSR